MERRRASQRPRSGFSLLEILIALAVVSVVAGFAAVSFRAPTPVVFANSVRTMLLQARFEAVRLNVPIVVAWNDVEGRFESRRANLSGGGWCANLTSAPISVTDPADFGRLTIETDIAAFVDEDGNVVLGQLVWIPSGQARTCSNGLYGDVFALVSDDRRSARIEVSFGGRVEVLQ